MNRKIIINDTDDDDLSDLEDFLSSDSSEDIVQRVRIINDSYVINIDGSLGSVAKYRKVFHILKTAKEGDVVRLSINSYGGCVDSALQLYNALLDTKAKTICDLYVAFSAGLFIVLACDEINIKKFAHAMIHQMSWEMGESKAGEIKSWSDFFDKLNDNVIKEIFKGFLTAKEMEKVLVGKDMWFTEKELVARFSKWIPVRARKA